MIGYLKVANQCIFGYYLVCNLIYLAMLIIALKSSISHQHRVTSIRFESLKHCPLVPPVSLLVPAHNEDKSVCAAIRNSLDLEYPELELIVINDGSTDATLAQLEKAFALRPVRTVYVSQVKSAPIRGLYRSDVDRRLVVVDKKAGGSKTDAINAGLNAATSPYICLVDGPLRSSLPGTPAGALATRFIGCPVPEPRYAVPPAIWTHWTAGASLFMVVRASVPPSLN
jgi:cellulose synthase/poly-beta-1,6-N-acetylglucosamine synthase-like glycosyltransferase